MSSFCTGIDPPAAHSIRILRASGGLDARDRGVNMMSPALRDAASRSSTKDAGRARYGSSKPPSRRMSNGVGIRLLSRAHMTLFPEILQLIERDRVGHRRLRWRGHPDSDVISKNVDIDRVLAQEPKLDECHKLSGDSVRGGSVLPSHGTAPAR